MAYNENPDTENQLRKESEMIEEEIRLNRKSWLFSHMTAIYIIVGALIAAAVFFGIRIYNDSTNPVSRFIGSTSKNLGSSFSFEITAKKNGETMMTYSGSMKADPSKQNVFIEYDASYSDFSRYDYKNVIYSDDKTDKTYKGNFYNGQWTIVDRTDRVNEYFDFFNDWKNKNFDSGSFLRFTGLNSSLDSIELSRFVDALKGRLSTDSAIAGITVSADDGYTTYDYDIDLEALFDFICDKGASVFLTSDGYNDFKAKIEANVENIEKANCRLSFTVDPSGYMSGFGYEINTGNDVYTTSCSMDGFSSSEPDIPEDFFTAAKIDIE